MAKARIIRVTRVKRSFLRRAFDAALIIVVLPLVLPLAFLGLILHVLNKIVVYLLVWVWWLPSGKGVLFVSSESTVWKEYMETQILPLVRDRATVLNWSERNKWPKWSFAVRVFRTFGRHRNHTPMVVIFRPFRRARVFRFLPAFKDFKQGHTENVEQLRRELVLALGR
jgi:hypothetical protein